MVFFRLGALMNEIEFIPIIGLFLEGILGGLKTGFSRLLGWGDQGLGDMLKGILGGASEVGTDQALEGLFGSANHRLELKKARRLGQKNREQLKTMFPGLTDYELAGSSSGGSAIGSTGGAAETGKQARKTQNLMFKQQEKIVDKQIEGQKKVAEISAEPAHRQAGVSENKMPSEIALNESQSADLRNQIWSREITTKFQARVARSQVALNEALTGVAKKDKILRIQQTLHEFEKKLQTRDARQIDRARVKIAEEVVRADLDGEKFKNLYTTLNTLFDNGDGEWDWEAIGSVGAAIATAFLIKSGKLVLPGRKKLNPGKGKLGKMFGGKKKDDAHLKFRTGPGPVQRKDSEKRRRDRYNKMFKGK